MVRFPIWAAASAGLLLVMGCDGDSGDAGAAGESGEPCTVTNNADGTATVTCPDGTKVTLTGGNGTPGEAGPPGEPGEPGEAGPPGTAGDAGTSCSIVDNNNGTKTITCTDGTTVTVSSALKDVASLTAEELADLDPTLVITGVQFPTDGKPVISMKITDRNGNPVKGMDSLTSGAGITWRASVLKLQAGVNSSANDTWVSYIAASPSHRASTESAAATTTPAATEGTLKDNGDGTYTYTFAKVINVEASAGTKYEADKPHRIVVLAYKSGNPFRPMDAWKDLIPATGADESGKHDIVNADSCMDCHSNWRAPALSTGAFHSGTRYVVQTCVACHNDQRRFNNDGTAATEPTMTAGTTPGTVKWTGNASIINGEAVLNLPVFIHKIHMGEELGLKPDRANGSGQYSAVQYDEVTYAQDIRNCAKCHNTATKAANWKDSISRRACGACHDTKSYVSPAPFGRTLHSGGAASDDTSCALCHGAGKSYDVVKFHEPVAAPNTITTGTLPASPDGQYVMSGWKWDATLNSGAGGAVSCSVASPCTCTTASPCLPSANSNAAWMAGTGFVPAGAAKITYDLKEVKVDATTKNPQFIFKFKKDGTDVDFGTYDATSKKELIAGFVGSPSVYLAYSLPQDGITAPADYNATTSHYIKTAWINGPTPAAGTASKLEKDTTTGYYTLTILNVAIPSTAKMLTGGIGYTYSMTSTQPLTQVDIAKYPYDANTKIGGLIVPSPNVYKAATGYTARRPIVETARCNKCHDGLGVTPTYHTGQRNDGPTCSFCHNPNRINSGWAVNSKDIIHAIHAGAKRTVPFTWHGEIKAWEVTYPGVLNTCTQCHLPGTYDFSATATKNALPNMLMSGAAQGTYNPVANAPATIAPFVSPYVTVGQNYGLGYTTSGTRTVGAQQTSTGLVACTATEPCTCSPTAPCNAEDTTLVNSPITAACAACHDSAIAKKHFADNGGSFYAPRGTAKQTPEMCLMCHGPSKIAAIAEVHK